MHPGLNLTVQNGLFETTDDVFVLLVVNQVCNEIVNSFRRNFVFEESIPITGPLIGRGKRFGFDSGSLLSLNRSSGIRRFRRIPLFSFLRTVFTFSRLRWIAYRTSFFFRL